MITLTSDFPDPYPAAMRGVLASRTDARLVDVAHGLPRQDVRAAAFWLREVLPYFPPAVHLVVVDPGVGTDREAVAVVAGDHALVGPDNGVLVPAIRRLVGAEPGTPVLDHPRVEPYRIRVVDPESATFHGRDVFAPAAAEVHDAGVDELGGAGTFQSIDALVDLTFPTPERLEDGARATVLVVDGFGNAITNVPGDWAPDGGTVTVDGESVPRGHSYAAVEPGEALVTVGSHGNLELAVNRGRGDAAFDVAAGDTVSLRWPA